MIKVNDFACFNYISNHLYVETQYLPSFVISFTAFFFSSPFFSQVEMQIPKSPFIATVNAVTSRQELRWIIEPVVPSESLNQTSEPTAAQRELALKRNIQVKYNIL